MTGGGLGRLISLSELTGSGPVSVVEVVVVEENPDATPRLQQFAPL